MNIGVILINLFFLGLLFYYQKKEKIYIGYTTVLCLLFLSIITIGVLENFFLEPDPTRLLHLSLWVLGSVLIYVTSQLTLAFEKITKLSQTLAIQNINEDTLHRADSSLSPKDPQTDS